MIMRRATGLICAVGALILVGLALTRNGDPQSPFASLSLIVVHLLAALPLAIGMSLFLWCALGRADRKRVAVASVVSARRSTAPSSSRRSARLGGGDGGGSVSAWGAWTWA